MKTTEVPPSVRYILATCPTAGSGVHQWLFVTALKLNALVPDDEELAQLLADATNNCGREVPAREIENAILSSRRIAQNPTQISTPRWSARDDEHIRDILRDGPSLAELENISPVRFEGNKPHTEQIVDALFPGNPLLCVAATKEHPFTGPREGMRGRLCGQQLIVPSPMRCIFGMTQDGQTSMRCLNNTGGRRFLVVEFDQGTFNQHAAILSHLGERAPLVLVVHSGNKSLHGWFYCAERPEEQVEGFFNYAVSLGADRATWTRCQFVRMPDGRRDNLKRQRVVFFNPKGLQT